MGPRIIRALTNTSFFTPTEDSYDYDVGSGEGWSDNFTNSTTKEIEPVQVVVVEKIPQGYLNTDVVINYVPWAAEQHFGSMIKDYIGNIVAGAIIGTVIGICLWIIPYYFCKLAKWQALNKAANDVAEDTSAAGDTRQSLNSNSVSERADDVSAAGVARQALNPVSERDVLQSPPKACRNRPKTRQRPKPSAIDPTVLNE